MHIRRIYKVLLISVIVIYTLHRLDINVISIQKSIEKKYQSYKLRKTIRCSSEAPVWLEKIINKALLHSLPAGQIAFHSKNAAISHCVYGYKNLGINDSRVSAKTRFKYASISKIFTSDAILSMVHKNQLSLDDKLVRLLDIDESSLKDNRISEITVLELLTHTAGFDRSISWDPMFAIKENVWCPSRLENLYEINLDFKPGSERHYSNLGYCLLGAIIEKKTKLTFEDYMFKEFEFDEHNIRFARNNISFEDEVSYHFSEEDLSQYMKVFNMDAIQSSAGMTGNAVELVKMVSRMVNKPEPNILTLDTQLPCIDEYQKCYALGTFKFNPQHSIKSYYIRNGSLPGFTGSLVIQPEVGVVAFLSNSRRVGAERSTTKAMEQAIIEGLENEDSN